MYYKANSIDILLNEYEKGRLTNLSKIAHHDFHNSVDNIKNSSSKLDRKKLEKLKQGKL